MYHYSMINFCSFEKLNFIIVEVSSNDCNVKFHEFLVIKKQLHCFCYLLGFLLAAASKFCERTCVYRFLTGVIISYLLRMYYLHEKTFYILLKIQFLFLCFRQQQFINNSPNSKFTSTKDLIYHYLEVGNVVNIYVHN